MILDKGKIVAKGTPIDLKERYSHDSLLFHHPNDAAYSLLKRKGLEYSSKDDSLIVPIENSLSVRGLVQECPEAFVDFELIKGRMDDVFLNVTGKDLRKEGMSNE